MMTESEFKEKFAYYFLDLDESIRKDGGRVNKFDEWERFVEFHIEEGDLPAEARNWKCPRSLRPWKGSGK
jgi:hypothetical protein